MPNASHRGLYNVEPDHSDCHDTSRGQRWNWRTELEDLKHMEQDKEQHGEQGKAENVDQIIKTRRRWRSGGGRLPDLISFSSKLAWIGDILSHHEDPDVLREMIQKESFEQKTLILVNSVGQGEGEQGAHLPHQC